jgi:polyphenol oxidase
MRSTSVASTRASSRTPAQCAGDSDWSLRNAAGVRVLQAAPLSEIPWLLHAFSTRVGGASKIDGKPALNLGYTEWNSRPAVATNRAKFATAAGARDWPLATLRQFHSDMIRTANPPEPRREPESLRGDALLTSASHVLLSVQTADCVPILFADKKRRAVAAIHAGWRGTLARIAQKTLGRMRMEFGTRPKDIVAALGPAIGRCCYEVGPEVVTAFAGQFPAAAEWFDGPFERLAWGEEPNPLPWLTMMPPGHVPPPPRVQLDLRAANRWQLLDAGVPASQITVSELCTRCNAELFFSYRLEREKTGRLMAVIGIRAEETPARSTLKARKKMRAKGATRSKPVGRTPRKRPARVSSARTRKHSSR